MSEYDELRLRGNHVAALAILRREPPPARELPTGAHLVVAPVHGPNFLAVLGERAGYATAVGYYHALRVAARADLEEITIEGGIGR